MPFIEHFELLNLLHYEVVETWAARESGSGRKLLLHRYPKTSGLRERLQSLPLEELALILKAGEDGDYFFVVTQDTPDFRRFLNWVDRLSAVEPAAEAPGEFTRVFQAPKVGPLRPQAPPAAPDEPGEFTRMFKGPAVPPQRPAPAPPPPVPAASVQEPGEFTKLFKSPAPETPLASAKAPAAAAEPGEFTQMFGRPNQSPNPVAPAPKTAAEPGELTRMFKGPTVQPQRPTPPGGGQPPSEFTKLFNSPLPETPLAARLEKPEAELKPAASFNEPGDFTKMFGRPNQNSTDWNASANPQAAGARATDLGAATGIFSKKNVFESAPPQPTLAAGPSEYTRLFQAGAGSAEGAAGAASAQAEQKAAPSPAAAKKQTQSVPIALIVILSAIAVVAIALILYFVFKR
jgi:hypothetical protein